MAGRVDFNQTLFSIFCVQSRCVPRRRGFPQGPRMKNLAGWFLKKNLPWGTVTRFSHRRRQVLVEVRCGAGTCGAPCILGRVLDSAFMQARVRLSCSDSLIYAGKSRLSLQVLRELREVSPFFLSWDSTDQPNHWTKRMASHRLAT